MLHDELHDEHITSILCSTKEDRRKERLQLAGIKCWVWYWFAVCPSILQNSWKNSAAHCCWPFWMWLLICGRQDTNVAGRTVPGAVLYRFRTLRVLHSKNIWPRMVCGTYQNWHFKCKAWCTNDSHLCVKTDRRFSTVNEKLPSPL